MDEKALNVLRQGTTAWNQWRRENPGLRPDLSGASLFGITDEAGGRKRGKGGALFDGPLMKGHRTDMDGIDFSHADLSRVFIESANLRGADLTGASLLKANFRRVNLDRADLTDADLYETDLYQASLRGASLVRTRLTRARLVDVDLSAATVSDCEVFGTAAWNVTRDADTQQSRLRVNDPASTWEAPILVDNLEVAQYVNLFLDPEKVRDVITATTEKLVLILGRFTSERKAVLDSIREELRKFDLVPVIFDFELLKGRSMIETVGLLARMSRFVVADLSDAKLVLNELLDIVPANPSLPVRPIIAAGQDEPAALKKLRDSRVNYLEPVPYSNVDELLAKLADKVVKPAEEKARELRQEPSKLFPD